MLPARRTRPRFGTQRAPKREYPRHRKFVRSFCCSACGSNENIEFAHVRTGTDGGTGLKPADWWGLSLCAECHRRQHSIGEAAFEKETGIDLKKKALAFAKASPVEEVRLAIRSIAA